MNAIRPIDATHTGHNGIHAKETRRKGSDLVGRGGLVLGRAGGRRGDQFGGGVGAGGCVGKEETIEDSAGVVQSHVVLDSISKGCNRDLEKIC